RQDVYELPSRRQLAAAARRAAVRTRHAGRLPADGAGVDELGPDGPPLRDRARDRQRQRGAVQRRRQYAAARHRLSDVQLAPVLRFDRAGARRENAPGARTDLLSAGVEHDPAGFSRLDGTMTLTRRELLKLGLLGAAHPLLPVRGIVSQVFAAPGAADAK